MKLLLFSDVHCSGPAVERLIARAGDADVLVGAGDFGTMRRGTADTLAPFRDVDLPQVFVPGNAESMEELSESVTWPQGHVLHGNGVTIGDIPFHGFGGGVPVTPFGAWSYDFSEDDAVAGLKDIATGGVLVVHSPPWGVVDVSSGGKHLGSTAIRAAVEQHHPALVVCGHIHDCGGQSGTVGDSHIVNAGPQGVLWDLSSGSRIDS